MTDPALILSLPQASTGGVLPLGEAAFPVFNNVSYDVSVTEGLAPYRFNYTLAQQGLTIDVSCRASSTTPITRHILAEYNVTSMISSVPMIKQQFDCDCPE